MAFRRVRLSSKIVPMRTLGSIAHRHRTPPRAARDAPDDEVGGEEVSDDDAPAEVSPTTSASASPAA